MLNTQSSRDQFEITRSGSTDDKLHRYTQPHIEPSFECAPAPVTPGAHYW